MKGLQLHITADRRESPPEADRKDFPKLPSATSHTPRTLDEMLGGNKWELIG